MRRRKLSKRKSFLSPKNKWARRGRNLAYFTASFIFFSFAYIFWWVASSVKWLFFIFLKRSRPSVKEANLANATDKKTRRSDTQADVRLPDRFARLEVLMAQLENRPIQKNLSVGSVIDMTDGCSKADLVEIVDIAARKASSQNINRKKGKGVSPISEDDLIGAIESVKSSIARRISKVY